MANEFVARKGLISSGSINVSGSVTASFFKGDGSQLTNLPSAAALSSSVSIDTFTFSGDGATQNYILSQSYDVSSLFVSVEGLSQTNIQDYTLTGATLSFINAPPTSSNILIKALMNVTQNMTGSFSGSFFGILASSSFATSASFAPTILPVGVVSSSTQVVQSLPAGTVSSSTQQVVSTYTNPTNDRVLTSTGTGGINGESTLTYNGTVLSISTNNAKYFQGGDDAALHDINIANTLGVLGVQDSTVGAIKLGSSGQTIYSDSTGVGIGTVSPRAKLHVQGNISASSVTGSLTGSFTGSAKFNVAPITLVVDNHAFVGNGVITNYTLSSSYDPAVLTVSVEGLLQTQTVDYTLSGTTLSFVTTPPTSSNIFVKAFRLALV